MVNQQLLLLNLSDPEAIDPGVYWYLGLALQLYAWFLLLRRLPSRWVVVITAVCWAMTAFSPDAMVTWLRYNSPGWMTEFSAGILLGRYQDNEATFRACHDKFKYFHTPSGTEGDTSHSCSCFIKLSTPWLYVPGCLALIFL